MPTHLLDSDVCIDLLGRRRQRIPEQIASILNDAAISVITWGEVLEGVLTSNNAARDLTQWRELTNLLDVVDVTPAIADVWAVLRGELRALGQILPDTDLLIASTSLAHSMPLVTRNERHFGRIAGLQLLVPA